jgi:hypothetical protein
VLEKTDPAPTLADGVQAHRLIQAIEESLNAGRSVELKDVKDRL